MHSKRTPHWLDVDALTRLQRVVSLACRHGLLGGGGLTLLFGRRRLSSYVRPSGVLLGLLSDDLALDLAGAVLMSAAGRGSKAVALLGDRLRLAE